LDIVVIIRSGLNQTNREYFVRSVILVMRVQSFSKIIILQVFVRDRYTCRNLFESECTAFNLLCENTLKDLNCKVE